MKACQGKGQSQGTDTNKSCAAGVAVGAGGTAGEMAEDVSRTGEEWDRRGHSMMSEGEEALPPRGEDPSLSG